MGGIGQATKRLIEGDLKSRVVSSENVTSCVGLIQNHRHGEKHVISVQSHFKFTEGSLPSASATRITTSGHVMVGWLAGWLADCEADPGRARDIGSLKVITACSIVCMMDMTK